MAQIVCGNCGGKVKLPVGYAKAKIRCEHCGYYAEVPPDQRAEAPADDAPAAPPPAKSSAPQPPPPRRKQSDDDNTYSLQEEEKPSAPPSKPPKPVKPVKPARARHRADPRDHRPEFVETEGTGPPLLDGTQDEDDGQPYAVRGTGLKNCPECNGELPLDATFCVHCGEHLEDTGDRRTKPKRTYTVIDAVFVEGFALTTRIALFAAAQFLNLLLTVGALYVNAWKIDATAIITGGFSVLINVGLQAFIIGSHDTFRVHRDERGRATLTRTRRLCFIPLPPTPIKWKQSVGVGRVATHAGDVFAWATCLYLLACAGCLPGVLFWWFVLRPERYSVALCDVYNGIEEVVFHAKDQAQAEEVTELIAEATTLQKKSVL